LRAANRDVDVARHVAVEADAAAELDAAAAHRRGDIIEANRAGIEMNRAVDRVERVGQREVADAAVGDRRAAGKLRLPQRTVDRGDERRASAGADVAEEPLQNA